MPEAKFVMDEEAQSRQISRDNSEGCLSLQIATNKLLLVTAKPFLQHHV